MQNSLKIYLLAFISFLIGTAEYIIAGILDRIAIDLDLPVSVAGQMITVFSIAFAIGTPIVIALTSQVDRKKLLISALTVFAFANLVTLALTDYGWLIFSRAVSGLSAGIVEVILLTLAATLAAPGKKAGAIAMVVIGFSAALVIGVPLGRLASSVMDWRFIFGVLGTLSVLSLVPIAYALPKMRGETDIPLKQQLMLLGNKKISSTYVMTFFWIAAFSIIYSYISPYLSHVANMSGNEISVMLLVAGGASIVGSRLGGWFTDRSGYAPILLIGFMVHAITLIMIFIFSNMMTAVFTLFIIWSAAAWSSGPAIQIRLISLAPESTSIIFSLYASIIQLGMAAGAIIGGVAIQLGSPTFLPIFALISVYVAYALLAKSSKKTELNCQKSMGF
ncbi:MAG: MFS transporter [Pseudomonadota bacterium]|nr:MFS transporter [Pseudomonadota bacterium]